MRLTQCDTILKAMLTNKKITWWSAKDFQRDPYFVGYEATARMSDLINRYDDLLGMLKFLQGFKRSIMMIQKNDLILK